CASALRAKVSEAGADASGQVCTALSSAQAAAALNQPGGSLRRVLEATLVDVVDTYPRANALDVESRAGGGLLDRPPAATLVMVADPRLSMRHDEHVAKALDLHVVPKLGAAVVILGGPTRDLDQEDWIDDADGVVRGTLGRAADHRHVRVRRQPGRRNPDT